MNSSPGVHHRLYKYTDIFNCKYQEKERMSLAKRCCLNKGYLYVRQETRLFAERLREVQWIYKVCLLQHSDAPPSGFYPVNQFCCFVLFKELCLWKKMLSACRFSLLLHAVCHTDPDCYVAAWFGPLHHYEWISFCQNSELKFIMSLTLNFVLFIPLRETWFFAQKKPEDFFFFLIGFVCTKVTDLI